MQVIQAAELAEAQQQGADSLTREERLNVRMNVLVLGVDQLIEGADNGQRSDTMFIMMFDPEQRKCSLLNQVMPVAELVGLVDESNPGWLLQGVEQIAAKAENGVGHVQCRQNAGTDVGLLGHFAGAVWRNFAWIIKRNRHGVHAPDTVEGIVIMFGVGMVGCDDEQGVVEPCFCSCCLEKIAQGAVGVIDGFFKTAPVVSV